MKNNKKLLINLLILLVLILPVLSFAQVDPPAGGLVACKNNCGFKDLMILIDTVIKFILFKLALPIAAIMFTYAGFLLVTAGGGEGKTKAKSIFTSTVMGLLFAAASWIIVRLVFSILGYTGGTWIGF